MPTKWTPRINLSYCTKEQSSDGRRKGAINKIELRQKPAWASLGVFHVLSLFLCSYNLFSYLLLLLKRRCPHSLKATQASELGLQATEDLQGRKKSCDSCKVQPGLRVHKDRDTLHRELWSQQPLVFQILPLLPLGFNLTQLLTLELPLSFLLFLVLTLGICSLTSISLTSPSVFSNNLSLDSHFLFNPFLVNSGSFFNSSLFPYPRPQMLA